MELYQIIKKFFHDYLSIYNDEKSFLLKSGQKNCSPKTNNERYLKLIHTLKEFFANYFYDYEDFRKANFAAQGYLVNPDKSFGFSLLFGDNKEVKGIYPFVRYLTKEKALKIHIGKSVKDKFKGYDLFYELTNYCNKMLCGFNNTELFHTKNSPTFYKYKLFKIDKLNSDFDIYFDRMIEVYLSACTKFEQQINNYLGKKPKYFWIDPKVKKKIEKNAINFTRFYYKNSENVLLKSVEKKNYGWDLEPYKRNTDLKIEVKGKKGSTIRFRLTPKEYKKMNEKKYNYKICVVSNALTTPQINVIERSNKKWRCYKKKPNSIIMLNNKIFKFKRKQNGIKKWKTISSKPLRIEEIIETSAECFI